MQRTDLNHASPPYRKKLLVETLEKRILYSADAGALLTEPQDTPIEAEVRLVAPINTQHNHHTQSETTQQRHEVVLIDEQVDDYQALVDDLIANGDNRTFEIVTINSDDDITQIADRLNGIDDVDAIHLITHGDAGQIQIGNTTLSNDTWSQYADIIASWSTALNSEADILIYGCNVAANADGQQLLNSIAAVTGADIAASTDLTGHTNQHGDWSLERAIGTIETTAMTSSHWQGTLALTAEGSETRANQTTSSTQQISDGTGGKQVAMDANGNFVIVWESISQDGSGYGIYAQRYDADGITQGTEFQVNSTTFGSQTNAAVAMDADGDFVITWKSEYQDGSGASIHAQRFDASGVAQGSEFQVNTYTSSNQETPAIAMDADGDFVITWSSVLQDGSGDGIYAQRYNAAGVAQGAEFQVNTYTSSTQEAPDIAMDADGNFVITWTSDNQDSSIAGIFAQRYNASGVAQGTEFQVNTFVSSNQSYASISMSASGDFIIAWESLNQDGNNYGVYAQRYDAAGAAQGSEFQVNTYTSSVQESASVAMDTTGRFIITWTSFGQDGSSYGVYAQAYHADGTTDGAEFHVSTSTTLTQNNASVVWNGSHIVVNWNGNGSQAGQSDSAGVFFQRYSAPTLDITSDLIVHLELDEGSGTTANDSAGGDNNGILSGTTAPTYTTGQIGAYALDFSAGNDVVTVADANNIDFSSGDFTISTWFNTAAVSDPSGQERLIGKSNGGAGFVIYNDDFGNTNFLVSDGTNSVSLYAGGYQDNTWHQVTAVRNGSTFELYIDNVLVDTATQAMGSIDNNEDLLIGQSFGNASNYNGQLDEVRIYGRALNTAEVELLYDYRSSAPTDLSSGIELNTDGGNDAYLIANDGGAIIGGLSQITTEIAFQVNGVTETPLLSYAANAANDLLFLLKGNGSAELFVNDQGIILSGIDYNTLMDGDLHQLALSWDNSSGAWHVYVDGALTDSGTGLATGQTIAGSTGIGELIFGQEQDTVGGGFLPSQVFDGTLYDVRIWSDVRSATEIALNYQNKLDTSSLPSGLIANWQMDGFNGSNEVVDIVSGNNLRIGGPSDSTAITTWTDQNGGASASGSTITFVDDGQTSWNSEVNSATFSSLGFTDNYTVSFKLDNLTNFGFIIGLGVTEDASNVSDVDYSLYFDHNFPGTVSVTADNANTGNQSLNYVAGDEFSFYVNGSTIEYHHNGNTFYTATGVNPSADFYIDSAFYAAAGGYANQDDYSLSNVRIFDGNTEVFLPTASTPVEDLHISENAIDGTTIGYVIPSDYDGIDPSSNYTFNFINDAGGRFAIDSNTGEITVADGSLIDYETATSHDVTVEVTDESGNSYNEVMTVAVDNAPEVTQTVPGAQTVNEDEVLTFNSGNGNAVTVSDTIGSTNNRLQVILSVNDGVLNLSQTTGITFIEGAQGSNSFVIEGTESDLNTAFEGMTFTPNANFNGSVNLNMQTALAADLEAYYNFNGGNANDQSYGTTYNGTLNGNAAIVNDTERGQVLSLDGAGDFVQINGLIGEPPNVTLSAWINANSVDTLGAVAISMGTSPALYLDSDGTLVGYYESGGANNLVQTTESLVGTGWRHVAVSIDATNSNMTLYVDGVAVETIATIGVIEYDNSPDTYIGRAGDGLGGFDFNGLIDEARIYDRALSADEIIALANNQAEVSDNVTITVNPVNDAPVIDLDTDDSSGGTLGDYRTTYRVSGAPVAVADSDTTFINADGTNFIYGEIVSFTGFVDAGQELLTAGGEQFTIGVAKTATVIVGATTFDLTSDGTDLQVTVSAGTGEAADWQSLLSSMTYEHTGTPTDGARSFIFFVRDAENETSNVVQSTINVSANAAPAFLNLTGSSINIGEDDAPTVLDADVTITDAELSAANNFDGATLTLQRSSYSTSYDNFSGTGTLSLSAGDVIVGTTTIGTYTNSSGVLSMTFNTNATNALVNEAMQQIAYNNTDQTPLTTLDIEWTFHDGVDAQTVGTTTVNITAVDDLGTIDLDGNDSSGATGFDHLAIYHEGSSVAIAGADTIISDVDDFSYGSAILNGFTGFVDAGQEVFTIGGTQFTVGVASSDTITYSTSTFDVVYDGTDFTITHSSGSNSASRWADFIEGIRYQQTGTPTISDRSFDITLTNSDGIQTNTATSTIRISDNDAPVFSNLTGSSISITEGDPATLLDTDVTITDAELTAADNFDGAILTLDRAGTNSADDIFSATGTLSFVAGDVIVSGVTIGAYTGGTGQLDITFNANATNALVNQAMQQIAYTNTSNIPPASLTINWTFSDGNTGAQGAGGAESTIGTTIVNITGVNDAPISTNDSVTFIENTNQILRISDFGSYQDETTLQGVRVTTLPTVGTLEYFDSANWVSVTLNQAITRADIIAGNLRFVPNVDETGSPYDTLNFQVYDGTLYSVASYTLTFNVTPNTDAFLQGNYLEVGLSGNGTLGSENDAPTGFVNAGQNLGVVADADRDGWAEYDGDFVMPGSPVENWGVRIAEVDYVNENDANTDLAGSLTNVTTNAAGQSVEWLGTQSGLDIRQMYSVGTNDLFMEFQIELTNNSGADLSDIYYFRDIDPDNDYDQSSPDGFTTTNTIISQGNIDGVSMVTATQVDGSYFAIQAFGENSRVTHGGFGNIDPREIFNGGGGLSQSGSSYADDSVSVAYHIESIADGETTTLRLRYYFGKDDGDIPAVDLDANDSSGTTGGDYTTSFIEDGGPVNITDIDAVIINPEGPALDQVTITISNLSDGADEQLIANTTGTKITANYNSSTGVLTLSGLDSVKNYNTVLQSIQYDNASDTPDTTTRQITVTATYDGATSKAVTSFVEMIASNDDPTNTGSLPTDITVIEDVASNIDLSQINLNDVDAAGGNLSIKLSTSTGGNLTVASGTGIIIGNNGSSIVTLNGTQANLNNYLNNISNIQYLHATANTNGNAADSINVTVNDLGNTGAGGGGDIDFGTVNINITQVNDAGTFGGNLSATTNEDTATSGTVTFTDTADGFTTPNFSINTAATNGTAAIDAAGNWTYTPNANFNGSDAFTVQVTDDDGNVETQVIAITVSAVTDLTAADDSETITEDTLLSSNVSANDSTTSGGTLTYAVTSGASNGTLNFNADGTYTYQGNSNFNGSDSFTYTVTDADSGESATQTVNLTITQVNDAGTFGGNLSATTNEDTATSGTVTFTDTADGFTTPNFSINTAATNGTAAIDAAGNWTYTPNNNYNGADSFTVQVTDDDGNVETQVITITVTAVNDAPTFGSQDGIVITSTATNPYAYSSVIQADGKIVVAAHDYESYEFTLIRYNVDGSLDTSFGNAGFVTTDLGGSDQAFSVTLQADGKILLAGESDNNFALARYNADGSLDTSFDGDGIIITDLGGIDYINSVMIQTDGKVLVGGTSDNNFALVRYNSDGSLDTSFDSDGIVITDLGGNDYAQEITLQPDGKILVAGTSGNNFALVRYNADGSLDTSFDFDGIVTTDLGGNDNGSTVTIQPDGKILVGGERTGIGGGFAVVRYNIDGSLDTSFGGGDGIITNDLNPNNDYARSIVVQTDGKILLGGSSQLGSSYAFALLRYDTNGNLDTSFGDGDGIVYTDIGSNGDGIQSLNIQADGKIVAVGESFNTFVSGDTNDRDRIAIVRYNSDGSLDTSFDAKGSADGTASYIEGGPAVALDTDINIFDSELDDLNSGNGDYNGASVTLVNSGGANIDDVISFNDGNGISLVGGNLIKNSQIIATFDTTTTLGQLIITFTNANGETPTSTEVDNIMRQITYANSSDTPPASVQLNWTFDDGNTGSQGLGGALTAVGSTTVNITPTNDQPSGSDAGFNLLEDTDWVFKESDFGFSDVEGDNFIGIVVTTLPNQGVLELSNVAVNAGDFISITDIQNGDFTYTPETNLNGLNVGDNSFRFQVRDDGGTAEGGQNTDQTSNRIYWDLNQVNDAGTFGGDVSATTNEDTATSGTVTFTDAADGFTTPNFTINTAATNGTAAIDAAGNWTYTPNANFNGSDAFTVQVTDDDGNVETQVISITVSAVADLTAADDSETVAEDTLLSSNVSANDSTTSGGTLTYAVASGVSNGTLNFNADGTYTYQGNSNFNGSDSFTYTVTDADSGESATQTVNLTITQVNDAGTFGGDVSATTNEDTATSGTVTFTDTADGYTGNTFAINTAATNGTAAIDAAGNWTYTPNANFNGSDAFTVQVTDDDGNVETQVISITVSAVADLTAADDSETVAEDTLLSSNVSANDSTTSGGTLTYAVASGASNGTLNFNADGSYTYQGNSNFNGSDSFTYTVTDADSGESATQTVTLTVSQVDDIGSFGGNLMASTNEDTATSGTITYTDTADGYTSDTFTLVAQASNGTASIDAAGNWTYTPNANYVGSDSFTVEVTDDDGNNHAFAISINVTQANDAGTFGGDVSATTNEDTATSGTVTFTDAADGFTTPNFTINTAATNGTAAIDAAGNWTYTPNANFNGSDSFTVQVTDDDGNVETQVIAITVSAVADLTAADDSETIAEDTLLSSNVSANDSTTSGGTLTYAVASGVSNGTLNFNADGTYTYQGNSNFNGSDSFTYTVTDADSGESATQTVNLTITQVNDAGTFGGDVSATTNEDTATSGTVTFTDTADGFTTPNFAINTAATNGTAAIDAAGNWTYTPNANFNGSDAFTVQVTDDDGNVETQVISITVSAVADLTAADDSETVAEDTLLSSNVSANDSTTSGGTLTYAVASGVSNGTLNFNADGSYTYQGNSNFNGSDSFTYTVTDADSGESATQTVNLTITQVNDAGTFGGDVSATTNEDTATSGTVTFTDTADGYTGNTFAINTAATNGTAAIDAAGNWTYTPNANFNGADSFTVQVTDDDGNVETQVIAITVSAVTDLTAADDSETVAEDTLLSSNVSANDSTTSGGTLTYAVASGVSNGTLNFNADGSYTYQGNSNFNGSDSFTYTVTDADSGESATQTVNLTITQVNDAGTFGGNLSATTNEDTATSGTVTFTDTADGYTGNTFAINTAATNGTASIDAAGNWTYTPNANFNGADSFTVQVTDDDGNVETQVIAITVSAVTDLTAADDSETITEDTLLSSNVSANDSTTSGGTLTYAVTSGASNGTLNFNADGTYTYQGNSNFNGSDSFTYTVTDADSGESAAQTVNLTITQVNDAGTFGGDVSATTNEDTATSGTVTFTDTADGYTGNTFAINTAATNGTAAIDAAGNWTYTPNANFNGADSFTVQVTDDDGNVETQVISITVSQINDAGTFGGNLSAITNEGTGTLGVITFTDPLDGYATNNFAMQANASNGTAMIDTDGNWIYTPNPNFNGADSFTVQVADDAGNVETAAVNITVNAENDNPILIDPNTGGPTPEEELPVEDVNETIPKLISTIVNFESIDGNIEIQIPDSIKFELASLFNNSINADASASNFEVKPAQIAKSLRYELSKLSYENITYQLSFQTQHLSDTELLALDNINFEQISDQIMMHTHTEPLKIGGVALSAGALWWALRATGLLASLLHSIPAWRQVDLLAILPADESKFDKQNS